MGLFSKIKKAVTGTVKAVAGDMVSADGILSVVAPQLGVSNALIKGITGGEIDPLKIAKGVGKNLIKGEFKHGEITNAAGEVIDMVSGSVKVTAENFESLKSSLTAENMAKIGKTKEGAALIKSLRQAERDANRNAATSAVVSALDLSQPNVFSQVFTNIAKNLPTSYPLAKSNITLGVGNKTYTELTATTAWTTQTVDECYEWYTDLVRVPLMSTPVSEVTTIVTLINSILAKLDDDNAMIEFLAIFNYAGDEVVLPNIEGGGVLADSCLTHITKELIYKHLCAWIKATYRNSNEFDFYRETISEWIGSEVAIAHPMYIDLLTSAVISIKGHVIARYLLENYCPYIANSANTVAISRYNETKLNPYDLLQFVRNMQLNAQINYANAVKPAWTAALGAVATYHQQSYIILTLVGKLLTDSIIMSKNCLTNAQLTEVNNRLMSADLAYVFELCNSDNAWIHVIADEDAARSIAEAQIAYSGIAVGETTVSISEIESGVDELTLTVNNTTDLDFGILNAYLSRCESYKQDIYDMRDSDEITTSDADRVMNKVTNLAAAINVKLGA